MTFKVVIAAIFAAYECYKLINTESYIKLIESTKEAGKSGETPLIITDPFFQRIMLIELAYIIFALILLFTAYWYFTLVLFTVSIVIIALDVTGKKGSLILGACSFICASLLMTIIMGLNRNKIMGAGTLPH
jgi:hypothetical protein